MVPLHPKEVTQNNLPPRREKRPPVANSQRLNHERTVQPANTVEASDSLRMETMQAGCDVNEIKGTSDHCCGRACLLFLCFANLFGWLSHNQAY